MTCHALQSYFCFNGPAPTEIYTLSLHDALPISNAVRRSRAGLSDAKRPVGSFIFLGLTGVGKTELARALAEFLFDDEKLDRKSTRLNSSHEWISYAVFCLKKKKTRKLVAPPLLK